MHTITFTCETITPIFISSADGTTPELSTPSIKHCVTKNKKGKNIDTYGKDGVAYLCYILLNPKLKELDLQIGLIQH